MDYGTLCKKTDEVTARFHELSGQIKAAEERMTELSEASVSSVISQIRKKLDPMDPGNGYIKTVVSSGYKFETDIKLQYSKPAWAL